MNVLIVTTRIQSEYIHVHITDLHLLVKENRYEHTYIYNIYIYIYMYVGMYVYMCVKRYYLIYNIMKTENIYTNTSSMKT